MMNPIGRRLLCALALLVLVAAAGARAAVDASVDRWQVALGDSLNLTLTASGDDDLQSVDLGPLAGDFDVLARNMRSSTTIVNGSRTHKRELQVELAPKRSGELTIPALRIGAERTQPIRISVGDAPAVDPGNQTVLFTAEVDKQRGYVQEQVILTLRLQQAINLDGRGISELELPDAFVVPLEQKTFQRQMNGRPWLVTEVRYAIFPEESGTLEIPPMQFSARESVPRRSVFDNPGRGRAVRRDTDPIRIEVLPQPAQFQGDTWLPARKLTLKEDWSGDPGQLQVGQSITRSVRISGEGLQGAQLPPVLYPPVDGLKFYPDQPEIGDDEVGTGLLGSRRDSVAIVPTREGSIELPAVEIPWWDTQTETLRKAVLPARTLHIGPAAAGGSGPTAAAQAAPAGGSDTQLPATGSSPLWQWAAIACALGWAVTLLLLLRRRDGRPGAAEAGQAVSPSTRVALRELRAACDRNDGAGARQALVSWADSLEETGTVTSLQQVRTRFRDAELDAALDDLETALYGNGDAGAWRGAALKSAVDRLRRTAPGKERGKRDDGIPLALYPQA